MSGFWNILKSIPALIAVIREILSLIREFEASRNLEKAKKAQEALEKMKPSDSEEERREKLKDVARNSF